MFDLNQAIATWRCRMAAAGIISRQVLDELESHLRDEIAEMARVGAGEEEAFNSAIQSIGQAELLTVEFAKSATVRSGWHGALKRVLYRLFAGMLIPPAEAFAPGNAHVLDVAREEAFRLGHHYIGTEHVLLGVLRISGGALSPMLEHNKVHEDQLSREIERQCSPHWASPRVAGSPPLTPRARRALRLARTEARGLRHPLIRPGHLFLGLLVEGDGIAGRVLQHLGLHSAQIRAEIAAS